MNANLPGDFKTIEQVIAELDAAPQFERLEVADRIREIFRENHTSLTPEDEQLLREFVAGNATAEQLGNRFAGRV